MAIKKVTYNKHSFDISYEIVNPSAQNVLVFLHGWGSNKELMKQAFGGEFKDYKHIYLDMPGFGKSSNDTVLTTNDYKEIINEFLKLFTLDSSLLTIFGHSFGGKVATLLNPKYLVLLSTAGILEQKSLKVKLKIKLAKILGNLGLRGITKAFRSDDVNNMSQNMYETFKNVLDEDFSQSFAKHKRKTFIFWGQKDTATTLSSGKKIAELIEDSEFYDFDGDHYFFLKYHNKIGEICESRFT